MEPSSAAVSHRWTHSNGLTISKETFLFSQPSKSRQVGYVFSLTTWNSCSSSLSETWIAPPIIAVAAISTGSQSNTSSCKSGSLPLSLTVLNINGQASLVFQMPDLLSPLNYPTRNIDILPRKRSCLLA